MKKKLKIIKLLSVSIAVLLTCNMECFAGTTFYKIKNSVSNAIKRIKVGEKGGGEKGKSKNPEENDNDSDKSDPSLSTDKKSDTKSKITETAESKCDLVIPEQIKKSVPEEMQYSVFLQMIINFIRQEYINELGEGETTEKALAGLLSSLDPHSSYLNKKAFTALKNQTDGEFGGLGIEIMMDGAFVRVISPIDDTPAYRAGLKSGDLIIYVNDECINGLSIDEILEKLRGKPGTKVKLKIKRHDKVPFDVTLKRDMIKVQSVKTEIYKNIGYIRVSTFDKNTSKDIKKFLNDNKNKGLYGLVIDVRNNPGGLLDEAIAVSDIFLDGGLIVSTKGRTKENCAEFYATSKNTKKDDIPKIFNATPGDMAEGMPIVVLVNSGTASAPEIMAGALRDNKRAIIVGTRSFGKGSVQKVMPLSENTAIRLTIAKHFTPSGECIQANGITPDIEADYAEIKKPSILFIIREESFPNALDADKWKANKKKSDEENRKALEALEKQENKKKKDNDNEKQDEDYELLYRKMPLSERAESDYQLSKAFDIIMTIEKMGAISKTQKNKVSDPEVSIKKNEVSAASTKAKKITTKNKGNIKKK